MITLKKGDCLELMKNIPDNSIDMILADLPYGTTTNNWDSTIDFKILWKEYDRIIKDNGPILLFGDEPFSSSLRMSNAINYRYDWYWKKTHSTGFFNAKKMPLKTYETISVFYKHLPTYNPQGLKKLKKERVVEHYKRPEGYQSNVEYGYTQKFTNYPTNHLGEFKSERGYHPTQKPVSLLEYLIRTYTNENDTVLDNVMGSGSTGVACVNTNRNFIGYELSSKYFDTANERINAAQNTEKAA